MLLATVGLLFWAAILAASLRVLHYFKGIEPIGDILGYKLLSMIMILALALLIFSGILAALSKLYLSRDLFLVHAMPISSCKIFVARWIDSVIDSSWMVIVYTLPIFISYGIIYQTGAFYYANMLMALSALALAASAISTLLVMGAVLVIPASRLRSVFIFLGILFFVVLYLAIRFLRPELLVDPEVFDTAIVYITSLQTPSSPFWPSTWVYDSIQAALGGSVRTSLFHTALCWSFAGTIVSAMVIIADAIYFKGFSKTQTAPARLFKTRSGGYRLLNFLPGPVKAVVVKEIKTFWRDQTQWSQLFLIAAIVVIYIYNFKVLPLDKYPIKTMDLQNLFSFLNMGLALFVLTAVAARFAYPAVSLEGEAFWIVQSSPLSLPTLLWIKFFIYYLPLLALTEILIIATNILLQVTPFMMILSTATVFSLVPGIVALSIGLGAAYPDFQAENPTQTVTSFGGLIFMIICAAYISLIILIEAGPVYRLFMTGLQGRTLAAGAWAWMIGSFTLTVLLSGLAVVLPMRFGAAGLAKRFT
ncbi:MAG: hypothetical protein JSW39_24965 [Desulfobacterales bacterium]|nr:MAG: hypothetical protein JSW39_24965 [Desulfobacterales bacterium]